MCFICILYYKSPVLTCELFDAITYTIKSSSCFCSSSSNLCCFHSYGLHSAQEIPAASVCTILHFFFFFHLLPGSPSSSVSLLSFSSCCFYSLTLCLNELIFKSSSLLGNPCLSILLKSTNNLSLFLLICFSISSILNSSLICAFLILSLLVFNYCLQEFHLSCLYFAFLPLSPCLCLFFIWYYLLKVHFVYCGFTLSVSLFHNMLFIKRYNIEAFLIFSFYSLCISVLSYTSLQR
jgi:hypothetical protein